MPLDGKVALVTGASRGIGRSIASQLGRLGAVVAVNYRSQREYAAEAVAQIESAGGHALPVQADLTDPAQIDSMMQTIAERLGPPAILVNNAGVLIRGDLEDFNLPDMEKMRGTNVDGLILVTRAVAGGMKKRGWGRIVNLTSVAAHGTAMKGTTFYAATKAAVALLTRRFAMDLGPHGVTVNAVAPGFILTDMVREGRSAEEIEQLCSSIAAKSMVRRVGTPEDVASAVAFLASAEAGFITGQVLTVDGGRTDYISHV